MLEKIERILKTTSSPSSSSSAMAAGTLAVSAVELGISAALNRLAAWLNRSLKLQLLMESKIVFEPIGGLVKRLFSLRLLIESEIDHNNKLASLEATLV